MRSGKKEITVIQAIIFDVDGTLWDAADPMAYGWTRVMNDRFDPDFFVDGNMIRPSRRKNASAGSFTTLRHFTPAFASMRASAV